MKPIVVLGMAQPYPGYGCEQVTIVASHILDTIVAFGQTCHNIVVFFSSSKQITGLYMKLGHSFFLSHPFSTNYLLTLPFDAI
jgi:hypothetical protein